jgi:tetratricopeptide (TPR) repeat protein
MRRGYLVALVLAGCLAAAGRDYAQAPAGGGGQNAPANAGQKPAAAPQAGGNQFPTDTSNVPVLPTKGELGSRDDSSGDNGSYAKKFPLPGEDLDPARSPDDAAPAAASGTDEVFSSSLTGLDRLLPKPGNDQTDKKGRPILVKVPTHKEAASADIDVGNYYIDRKNWKAALSRFESAMVLDPDNPEVYWGLAEAERHLGDFWDAKGYYQKAALYDPDSRHGKDAMKALREPEIANAKKPVDGQAGK